jgi:hypothetical protein
MRQRFAQGRRCGVTSMREGNPLFRIVLVATEAAAATAILLTPRYEWTAAAVRANPSVSVTPWLKPRHRRPRQIPARSSLKYENRPK